MLGAADLLGAGCFCCGRGGVWGQIVQRLRANVVTRPCRPLSQVGGAVPGGEGTLRPLSSSIVQVVGDHHDLPTTVKDLGPGCPSRMQPVVAIFRANSVKETCRPMLLIAIRGLRSEVPHFRPRTRRSFGPPSPAAADGRPPEADPGSTQRWVGIGTGAVGVIALGIGTTFGVIALGKQSDLDAACPGYPRCPNAQRSAVQATYDDAKQASTIATVGIVGGGVLVAAGVVLWLTAPTKEQTVGFRSLLTPSAGSVFRMDLAF